MPNEYYDFTTEDVAKAFCRIRNFDPDRDWESFMWDANNWLDVLTELVGEDYFVPF